MPTTASSCAITSIRSSTNSGNRSFHEFETSSAVALMRILTIVDLPWDTRLGAARIFMELSRTWEAAGHEVSHYCLGDAFPAATSSPAVSAWRRLRFPAKAAAFVRKDATRFDVIDCIVGALPVRKERLNFAGLLVARSIGSHRLYRDFEKMARTHWPDPPRGKLSGRIFYTIFQQQLFRNSEKALQYCDLVNLPNETELECLEPKKPAIVQPSRGRAAQASVRLASVCVSDLCRRFWFCLARATGSGNPNCLLRRARSAFHVTTYFAGVTRSRRKWRKVFRSVDSNSMC